MNRRYVLHAPTLKFWRRRARPHRTAVVLGRIKDGTAVVVTCAKGGWLQTASGDWLLAQQGDEGWRPAPQPEVGWPEARQRKGKPRTLEELLPSPRPRTRGGYSSRV